jgi:hypothetical protein
MMFWANLVGSSIRLYGRCIPLPILTRNASTYALNTFKLPDEERARARPSNIEANLKSVDGLASKGNQ